MYPHSPPNSGCIDRGLEGGRDPMKLLETNCWSVTARLLYLIKKVWKYFDADIYIFLFLKEIWKYMWWVSARFSFPGQIRFVYN